ncbi:B-cell receptor CD22 [Anas platyrhynchos]|uniref:B-cell receptor CD22 n=1 Tax=Anas platyrhynchos TaxID=8839 RepID=R0JN26_ANAPL|nr:B-cell receptor CD22 [Anas platyrhynchos]
MPASPVREGWEVTLSCHDSANPPSSVYSWSLNGLRLSSSTDKLLLRSAQVHDGGTYHCRATNAVGSVESHPTDLEVYYAPRDVRVEVTSPVCEGKEVTLKCRDSANPPSHTYAWILEGQILPHSSAQFRLWPVREVDGGSYRCQATNDIGTADSPPTFLEVYYQPRNATLTVLNPLPVLAGTRVSLHCELGPAHPPPSAILWLRNDRHQASTTGPIFSFTAEPTRASTYRCVGQNVAGFTQSPPLAVIVWYTRATILRKTFLGLGVGLGSLLLLGALGCFLRRRWQRQMAADEEPVVEPSGTFFLRNKKPPHSADDTISYSSLVSPPGSGPVPRVQGDTVVYSVLKRNDGAAKATEGPDYENVPSGPRSRAGDRDGDRDGTLLYAALALSPPVTAQEHAGGMEDAVEYAALRH